MSVFEKLLYKMGVFDPKAEIDRALRRERAERIISDVQKSADEAAEAAHARRGKQ